jgi:hypothetical protein
MLYLCFLRRSVTEDANTMWQDIQRGRATTIMSNDTDAIRVAAEMSKGQVGLDVF